MREDLVLREVTTTFMMLIRNSRFTCTHKEANFLGKCKYYSIATKIWCKRFKIVQRMCVINSLIRYWIYCRWRGYQEDG